MVVGKTIVDVRQMTEDEMEREMWHGRERPAVLVLDDGTEIFPSADVEGNGAGWLYGHDPEADQGFYVDPPTDD